MSLREIIYKSGAFKNSDKNYSFSNSFGSSFNSSFSSNTSYSTPKKENGHLIENK